jgi:regulation of enolase protein 1 (concanavalin A-like superfamily)
MGRTFLAVAALSALALAADAPQEPKPLFEDRFEGKLAPGWTWLRENRKAWRIEKGVLEIRVEPGVADTVKNALVRPAPDRTKGAYAIDVTVSNAAKPTNQYEQGGITWYVDKKPVFKIVKELIDGKIFIIPGKVPVDDVPIQLRVVVDGNDWTARFRPEGKGEWKTAGTGKLPAPKDDAVSIQCYNGPKEAEHWIRFDDFRFTPLEGKPDPKK